jgi:hypothetical protein
MIMFRALICGLFATATFWSGTCLAIVLPAKEVSTASSDAIDERASLNRDERTRLRELGSGVRDDLKRDDFPLVERGFHSSNVEDRQWAYLAVEKLGASPDLPKDQYFAKTLELVQQYLSQAYVAGLFPQLLDSTANKNGESRI